MLESDITEVTYKIKERTFLKLVHKPTNTSVQTIGYDLVKMKQSLLEKLETKLK